MRSKSHQNSGHLTFGDGALDLCTLDDDVAIVERLILLDEVEAWPAPPCAIVRVPLGGEPHLGDHHPLQHHESDAHGCCERDDYLRRQLRQDRYCNHRQRLLQQPFGFPFSKLSAHRTREKKRGE
jgi:hypothetical protein